jgi:hypothetical protein
MIFASKKLLKLNTPKILRPEVTKSSEFWLRSFVNLAPVL